MPARSTRLTFRPVTAERWDDLEALFGPRGACGGCWCMSWRLAKGDFDRGKGDPNRSALRAIIDTGEVPGLLAYADGDPIGWCSVAPRERFPRLEQHRTLKRLDHQPVWSIVCLFVAKPHRRHGVSVALLRAAVEYARGEGARIVEGYPTEPGKPLPDPFVWTGLVSAFRDAGFAEVARPARTRPVMRRQL